MAGPFLSENTKDNMRISLRKGWALCNGQLLPINQNQPLFSLLGTTFRERQGDVRPPRPS